MQPHRRLAFQRALAFIQGVYYAVTGLWPLVSLQTFQFITGRKTDTWLVQTVGALVLAIALCLLLGAVRGRVVLEVRVLGLSTAAAFALVDVVFWAQGRIGAIYLADAALEVVLFVAWIASDWLGAGRRRDRLVGT